MADLVTVHDDALAATARIVAGIDPSQLSLRTPCDDFDVRALLEHLVGGNHRFVAVANGVPGDSVPLEADLGDGWADAYEASATSVGDAWRDPELMDRMVDLPVGLVPGAVALGMHVVETAVHGWDLATSTGQPDEIASELCEVAWQNVQGVTDELRGPGGPFGPAVAVPDDSTPTDRLVAWLGRAP